MLNLSDCMIMNVSKNVNLSASPNVIVNVKVNEQV